MDALITKEIETPWGMKSISVHAQELADLDEPLDVMTVSAFHRNYDPVPRTMMETLAGQGVDVKRLAEEPEIDLRSLGHVWLSRELTGSRLPIRRIGCVEMSPLGAPWRDPFEREEQIIAAIQIYFRMLGIAATAGLPVQTVGLPILGGGNQQIPLELVLTPILTECVGFLRDNRMAQQIRIITRSQSKAYATARALEDSYLIKRENTPRPQPAAAPGGSEPLAFISYSSEDRNVADNLCAKLEAAGVRVWYAPRNIKTNDYATAIVEAISACSHFVLIMSGSSLQSQHVLNEIALAFGELSRKIRFCILRIDEEKLGPAFKYYLGRQHWMDAHLPPLEERLKEFVQKLLNDSFSDGAMPNGASGVLLS